MNFLSMKYFLAVEKERSFTKAAEKLYITQQTLSTHIAGIEKELGVKLFNRTSPLEITYAGEVFKDYAKQFDKLKISMDHEFSDINNEKKGILRVGISHSRSYIIMPEVIKTYKSIYPNIEIQIIENTNDNLCKQLLDNEIDLVIASFSKEFQEIELRKFYEEKIVLILSKNLLREIDKDDSGRMIDKIAETHDISDLYKYPFLMGDQKDISGIIGEKIISKYIPNPDVRVRSSNIETLLELCIKGMGACFCPDMFINKMLDNNKLSQVEILELGPDANYEIKFGWLKQPYLWRPIADFIDIALSYKELFL